MKKAKPVILDSDLLINKFKWPTRPPSIVATLRRVREILEDPERWTKGRSFRRGKTYEVAHRVNATACCLSGALDFVGGRFYHKANHYLKVSIDEARPNKTNHIVSFNDRRHTTHQQLLEVIDTAIWKATQHTIYGRRRKEAV